jgi:hypothetical protein
LYLLPNTLGIYVTFQVVGVTEAPIAGATIAISNAYGDLESATTDAAGSATFFLNPLVSHTIVVSKTGYETYTTTITPTQSSYTISLAGGGTTSSISDYFRGIDYSIKPIDNYLLNDTTYNFNFTISTSYWDLDSFGFVLTDQDGNVLGGDSLTSSGGGLVSDTINTGNYTLIKMNAYWVIDGNYTNVTKQWIVFNGEGTDTSLSNFITDLRMYLAGDGFFGLKSGFGLTLICFFVIFITTGILTYKFGFSSPASILGILLGLTLIFEFLGLIVYSEALPNYAGSLILGIILVGYVIKEAYT